MVLHVGNTEEENNGYVVLKMKYPWISWEIWWWWGGEVYPPPTLSTNRLLDKYLTTTCRDFPASRIFASWGFDRVLKRDPFWCCSGKVYRSYWDCSPRQDSPSLSGYKFSCTCHLPFSHIQYHPVSQSLDFSWLKTCCIFLFVYYSLCGNSSLLCVAHTLLYPPSLHHYIFLSFTYALHLVSSHYLPYLLPMD